MPDLKDLCNARFALLEEIKAMQDKLADVDHQILVEMQQSGIKEVYSDSGLGVQWANGSTKYDFGKAAYAYLRNKGLLEAFRPEPKLTKGALEAAVKDGVLSEADYGEVWKHCTVEQGAYTLRKVVAK